MIASHYTYGNRVPEELALDVGRQIVPPRDDRGTEIPEDPLLFLGETRLPVAVFRRGPAREAALVVPAGEGPRRPITRARVLRFSIDHGTDTGSGSPSADAWSDGRVTVERPTAPPASFVPRSAVRRHGRQESRAGVLARISLRPDPKAPRSMAVLALLSSEC